MTVPSMLPLLLVKNFIMRSTDSVTIIYLELCLFLSMKEIDKKLQSIQYLTCCFLQITKFQCNMLFFLYLNHYADLTSTAIYHANSEINSFFRCRYLFNVNHIDSLRWQSHSFSDSSYIYM